MVSKTSKLKPSSRILHTILGHECEDFAVLYIDGLLVSNRIGEEEYIIQNDHKKRSCEMEVWQ